MNLQRKLEEIRRKPAHIRLRYTYTAVAISMFFVLLLWFFSLSDTVKKATAKRQNVFEGMETEKKSLKDATDDVRKSIDDLNDSLPTDSQPIEDDTKYSQEQPQSSITDLSNSESAENIPPPQDQNEPPLNNPRPLPSVKKPLE